MVIELHSTARNNINIVEAHCQNLQMGGLGNLAQESFSDVRHITCTGEGS